MSCKPDPVCVSAGGFFVLMSRVANSANALLDQAGTTSVRVDVYLIDGDTRTPVDASGASIIDGSAYATPPVASVVFDALQVDARWSIDGIGYNFAYALALPVVDQLYEVRVTLGTLSGESVVIVYRLNAI